MKKLAILMLLGLSAPASAQTVDLTRYTNLFANAIFGDNTTGTTASTNALDYKRSGFYSVTDATNLPFSGGNPVMAMRTQWAASSSASNAYELVGDQNNKRAYNRYYNAGWFGPYLIHDQSWFSVSTSTITPTSGNFLTGNGTAWASTTPAAARTAMGLGDIATQGSTFLQVTQGYYLNDSNHGIEWNSNYPTMVKGNRGVQLRNVAGTSHPAVWVLNQVNTVPAMDIETNGGVKIRVTQAGNIYIINSANGVIHKAPDGGCWLKTVDNSGAYVTASITCPNY